MNKIFLSYQDSSHCFLSGIKDTLISTFQDYLKYSSLVKMYDYTVLENSVVTQFSSEQGNFIFFEIPEYEIGFLGKIVAIDDSISKKIHPLHLEMYTVFGSIIDSYSITNSKELLPYSEVFLVDNDIFGLADLESDYLEKCEKDSINVIPSLLALTTLAVESNGNLVQYNEDGDIYLYLADHLSYDAEFTQVDAVPQDTFYGSNETASIKEWIDNYFSQYFATKD